MPLTPHSCDYALHQAELERLFALQHADGLVRRRTMFTLLVYLRTMSSLRNHSHSPRERNLARRDSSAIEALRFSKTPTMKKI